jgi:hypothetical protein
MRPSALALLALAALPALGACARHQPAEAVAEADPQATLPTPYTAAQLQAAYPMGHVMRLQERRPPDPATRLHTVKVVAVDADGVVFRTLVTGPDGQIVEGPHEERASFEQLRLHAAFPAASTRVEIGGVVEVPAGRFEVTTYTVEGEGRHTTYDFDLALPGPPVRMVVAEGGVEVLIAELYSRDPLP